MLRSLPARILHVRSFVLVIPFKELFRLNHLVVVPVPSKHLNRKLLTVTIVEHLYSHGNRFPDAVEAVVEDAAAQWHEEDFGFRPWFCFAGSGSQGTAVLSHEYGFGNFVVQSFLHWSSRAIVVSLEWDRRGIDKVDLVHR